MHMMSILCSAADILSSGNQFTLFKVLMLNVSVLIMFLHLSNFGQTKITFGSVSDFQNTEARAQSPAECVSCLLR